MTGGGRGIGRAIAERLANDGARVTVTGRTAAELEDVALFCRDRGLRPGDRAAIFAHNRVEWMSAALGIQAAGGVMVPIYPASTTDQAAYIVSHSEAALVLAAEVGIILALAAWLGPRHTRTAYATMLLLPHVLALVMAMRDQTGATLGLLLLPPSIQLVKQLQRDNDGPALNALLANTAKAGLMLGLLWTAGLFL